MQQPQTVPPPPPPAPPPSRPVWQSVAVRVAAAAVALAAGAAALAGWVVGGILLSGCFISCGPPSPFGAVFAGLIAAGAAALAGAAATTTVVGTVRSRPVGAAAGLMGTVGALAVLAVSGAALADHGHTTASWVLLIQAAQLGLGIAAATTALRTRGGPPPGLAYLPVAQLPIGLLAIPTAMTLP